MFVAQGIVNQSVEQPVPTWIQVGAQVLLHREQLFLGLPYSKFLMVTTLANFDRKCLFTWLPVLLLPDTEKDCGLGLIVSSHAVYSIPQKLRSIRTHLEDKKRKTIVLSRKTYML